MNLFCI